jgi:cytochrome c-type biogenesis protein CcmH
MNRRSTFHSKKIAKPNRGGVFEVKMAEKARQCWGLLKNFIQISTAILLSFFAFATFAEPSGTAPILPNASSPSPEMELRIKKLETELRCLVCQNQTLADSPSGLAGDLRREVRILAASGKTDEEIKTHLADRYGDFVLYKPPMASKTYLLWFGPFALLFGGGVLLWWLARGRAKRAASGAAQSQTLSADDAKRARSLLGE